MTQRRYRFQFSGAIAVDDTTVRSAILGFEIIPAPGVDAFSEDEKLQIMEQLLGQMEDLDPASRLQLYLANGVFDEEFEELVLQRLRKSLPGAVVDSHGVTVTVTETG